MEQKIFCIGDSRTGTMSLHRFFSALGIQSIHNPVREANQSMPLHESPSENWRNFKEFIDRGNYQAFSDYPARYFYKELIEAYPDALFILTKRRELATWQRSMIKFFAQYSIPIEINKLSQIYEQVNSEIIALCATLKRRLLVIDIDGDNEINSAKIKDFLAVVSPIELGWENKGNVSRGELLSDRAILYDTRSHSPLQYIEAVCAPGKAMLSEYGWVFLVNDTNQFLQYQFGVQRWTDEELNRAVSVLRTRDMVLGDRGVSYLKFVVPEKSVIYREYLPKRLANEETDDRRPALLLAGSGLPYFHYLEDFLVDAKSYGQLYFRGDSHPNWIGAYFCYVYIVEKMNRVFASKGKKTLNPLPLASLKPELAVFDGDLSVQLNDDFKSNLKWEWGLTRHQSGFESLVRYSLQDETAKARIQQIDDEYLSAEKERKTIRMTNQDAELPRAVIFRDSTTDFLIDLLAQHFSNSVFVWRDGLVFDDVVEKEQPDVVLHIMAERFLRSYPKTVAFAKLFSAR